MCSTCDCDQTPIKVESPVSNLNETSAKPKSCRKCPSDPFIVLDKVHIECRKCFLESCNKKIRSTLGKSKLMKNNDPILIAYSGGASSEALLDLIKNSMEYDTRREQKFRPSILHVDTQSVIGSDFRVVRAARLVRLKSLLEHTHKLYPDWPLYWTTIEMSALPSEGGVQQPLCIRYDPHEALSEPKFNAILDNAEASLKFSLAANDLTDLTDRQQYIQDCTANLINRVANVINSSIIPSEDDSFKFVFTASSATQLANNLLVDVILGHGATIHSTVSICDSRPSVSIVRPMRDFSKKEIAFYLKARKLEFHVQANLATFADRRASIQTVTEAFLSKLYVDYPSTYSTLLRTGNKMQDQSDHHY